MEAVCNECGKQYLKKRETSKFCSGTCRSKAHKKEKRGEAGSEVAAVLPGVPATKESWVPTKRESVLNALVAYSDLNIFKIECLALKLERSPLVDEILALAAESSHVTFHNEVRAEVDGFDMMQRLYEADSFEARTGILLADKRKPQ